MMRFSHYSVFHRWGIEEGNFGDVTLDDAVALEWTNRGTRFYMYDGDSLYGQEFRDQNGRYETTGNLKSVKQDHLYELEGMQGSDFDGDGSIGEPSPVIERVIFAGSDSGGGSLFELESGEFAFTNDGEYYEEGDELTDYCQTIEESNFGDVTLDDAIAMQWGSRGPRIYFLDRGDLYSQDFRDRNGDLQASGKLKSVSQETLYELEDISGEDYDGDGEIGEPTQVVESVLFSGSEGSWDRGLYELDDASLVMADPGLEEGDTPSDVRQLVTSNGDDFSVDGDIRGAYWINRGFAVVYADGNKIMRQNFRETGDVARTNGRPQSLSSEKVAALEDEHGVDYNSDGVYGSESSVIASVLFDGEEGSWGWGLYELDDSSVVVADVELGEGDTPSDSRQLVTNKGDDFSVDGEVLGGYGINRGFAVLYEDGVRIMRQNFRETGDVASPRL